MYLLSTYFPFVFKFINKFIYSYLAELVKLCKAIYSSISIFLPFCNKIGFCQLKNKICEIRYYVNLYEYAMQQHESDRKGIK